MTRTVSQIVMIPQGYPLFCSYFPRRFDIATDAELRHYFSTRRNIEALVRTARVVGWRVDDDAATPVVAPDGPLEGAGDERPFWTGEDEDDVRGQALRYLDDLSTRYSAGAA